MNNQELIDRIQYLSSKLADAYIEASSLYAGHQSNLRKIEELGREVELLKKEQNVEDDKKSIG